MKGRTNFPFAAIVGQEDAKEALLISLVNPKAGGVLIAGEKGTAKSSMVRSAASLCGGREFVELPLNATEDRIFGHIDLERAVMKGQKVFSPGILARANGQVLYVDEINLLRRDLLTSLLDTVQRGENIVEREGVSHRHDAVFVLVGTMNPEEGVLPPAILDRFGMFVAVENEQDIECRTEIVRRVLAYEKSENLFCHRYQSQTQELAAQVSRARELLAEITVDNAMMELAAQYAMRAWAAGHRAELFLIEAAKGVAALAGREYLLPTDMERAAFFVLPHRVRKEETPPEEGEVPEENSSQEQEDSSEGEKSPEMPPDISSPEDDHQGESEEKALEETGENPDQGEGAERTTDIDTAFSPLRWSVDTPQDRRVRQGSGKRSLTRTHLKQGRYVRACLPKGKLTDLAFDATIRAAAPYQRFREKGPCCLVVCQEDLRQKVREKRIGHTFLFLVDASGSMGAYERMRAVKGAVFSMLQDAYQKRDQVGLIAFRRQTAEVMLPVTRSVDLAQKCLQKLPTGGKTPLAEGLCTALNVLHSMKKREKEMQPILVLVTDGRANRGNNGGESPVEEALKEAGRIGMTGISSVVIDTETDFVKLGVARAVAREMGSSYYRLKDLSGDNILHIVKNSL